MRRRPARPSTCPSWCSSPPGWFSGLYGLWFIYTLTQDDFGADFGDRLFGGMENLATGIFYAAVLLAVSVWLGKQNTRD